MISRNFLGILCVVSLFAAGCSAGKKTTAAQATPSLKELYKQGRGYALGVGEVKLTGMVRPDRKMLRYFVDFTKAVQTRRLTMGVADGRVEADGEVIYLVKDMKVALSAT